MVVGGLVPPHGEDIGGRGGGGRAADHEPEVPGTGRGDHRRLDGGDELVHHVPGRTGAIGQAVPEGGPDGVEIDLGVDGGVGHGRPVGGHVVGGVDEEGLEIGHARHPSRARPPAPES